MGVGRRIADRYVLAAEIGAGGMGVVWRAHDDKLGRDVAVKLLTPSAIGSETARARLLREARATAQLRDDHIVHVYDVGETADGGAFLVMELVAGRTLRELLEEGQLSVRRRLEIVLAVAEGLAHAHEAGILHRDIKPDNILVRDNGKAVILDFGLAKPITAPLSDTVDASAAAAKITREGDIVGTPAYLAPEQIRGVEVGPAADQLALAVTTFELLTGRLPWAGANALEVIGAILHQEPLVATALTPGLPAAVDAVLARAMKKEPDDRFASVAAFAEALAGATTDLRAAFPDSQRILIQAAEPAVGEARTISSMNAETAVAPPPATPPRSRRALLIAALLGVLVVALGVRFVPFGGAPASPAAPDSGVASLAPADLVVACPPFAASGDGVDEPSGWLGAAGAALACERVQILLGGASSTTLSPAELVPETIPREAVDAPPTDAFSKPAIGAAARKAAKERAPQWLDGKLERRQHGYRVDVDLRRSKDDVVLAHVQGEGAELFEAVSVAVRGLRDALHSTGPSEFQRTWMGVQSIDAALDVHDLVSAVLGEQPTSGRRLCVKVRARTDLTPELAYIVRAVCARRIDRTRFDEEPPPLDEKAPLGTLVSMTAAQQARGGLDEVKKRVARLKSALGDGLSLDEQAILMATSADLLYLAGDNEGATSAARMAIHASPKVVDVRGTPWYRLAFAVEFDAGVADVSALWLPWVPVAVENAGTYDLPFKGRLAHSKRAYLLAQRGFFSTSYAELLVTTGRTVEAATLAEENDSELLRIRVMLGEAKFKKVLETVSARIESLPDAAGSASTAFRLASVGADASRYLGRPADFVDVIVKRFLDAEPPHLKGIGMVPFVSLVDACTVASRPVGKRCVRRLRELFARGDMGGVFGGAPALLEGADAWVSGDVKAAARAWRPLLRVTGAVTGEPFRHALAEAFDRAGLPDNAEAVDRLFYDLADMGGLDLALVRGARRASKRGDHELAQRLARACVAKFNHADADVAGLAELEALAK
jgi:predicted Ser/Thr protein kinase